MPENTRARTSLLECRRASIATNPREKPIARKGARLCSILMYTRATGSSIIVMARPPASRNPYLSLYAENTPPPRSSHAAIA